MVRRKLKQSETALLDKARKEASEQLALELADREKEIAEKDVQLSKFRKAELQLREEKRRVEAKRRELQLEVARKIDEERKKVLEVRRH